ncbi:hypothetical protein ACTXT7_005871 [Hymenolepis weldensis]
MTVHLPTGGIRSPSDIHTTNIRSSYSQDADFTENVIIIETAPYEDVAVRIPMTVTIKKASVETLLRIDAMLGYIPAEDNLQVALRYRSNYQPRGPRLDR